MSDRMQILLAEDEPELANSVVRCLEGAGWQVDIVADGVAAGEVLARGNCDLAILDVGLPQIDGFSVLSRLREHDKSLPVLMLTARGEVADRVRGLNLGADDYLAKPFEFDELRARVRALLRRGGGKQGRKRIRCGSLAFDAEARRFQIDGRELVLTPREHSLLAALMARPGRLLSKDQLAQHVFDLDDDANLEAIEVHVHRLRRKLEGSDVAIVTMRGLGYLLEARREHAPG